METTEVMLTTNQTQLMVLLRMLNIPGPKLLLKESVEDLRLVTRILLMSNQETFGTRCSQIKTELTLSQTFLDLLVELDQKSNKVCLDSFGELIQTMELELLRLLVVIFQQNANWKMARRLVKIKTKKLKQQATWPLELTKLRFKLETKLTRQPPLLAGLDVAPWENTKFFIS